MAAEPAALDRRHRRRQETIEEILDVALEVMAEQGVGGLSLGEVARRMGMRTPSLYGYFDSKNALYDAIFERGARLVLDASRAADLDLWRQELTAEEHLTLMAEAFLRWMLDHQSYAQLLFWRVVPGFEPSPEAYAPAVELVALGTERFREMQRRGLLRDDVPAEDILRDWTVVTSGIGSQQLSNAPTEPFEQGRFTRALPSVVAMFAAHYAPSRRRTRRADQR